MAYMKDSTGRRLDTFPVVDAEDKRLTLVPAASRGLVYASGLSNGTDTSTTYKTRHQAVRDITDLTLVYGNFYNVTGAETMGPNDISVKFTVETPTDLFRLKGSFNGKRTITIEPGCKATSDPLGVEIKAGEYFYIYTYVSVASAGMKWPVGLQTNTADGEGRTANVDYTDTGTTSNTAQFAHSPMAILSPASSLNEKVIGGIGDSILTGTGDGNTRGFWSRGLGGLVAAQRVSYPSETAQGFNKPEWSAYRFPLLKPCTHIVCELGINDVKNGRTASVLKGLLLNIAEKSVKRGAKAYQTTLTPVASSTDGFATTANQTPSAQEAERVAVNDWIRAGAPIDPVTKLHVAIGTSGALLIGQEGHPITAYIDLASVVESSVNSGKWVPTYTTDGTHPNVAGHTAMGAYFTPALFD